MNSRLLLFFRKLLCATRFGKCSRDIASNMTRNPQKYRLLGQRREDLIS
jgi:hypothetical protein